MSLTNVHYEMLMEAPVEDVWNAIRQYANVAEFHGGVERTTNVNGGTDEAYLGANRVCYIHDMGLDIVLKEKIIKFNEGSSYRYEVYETKNFPVQDLYFEFSIHGHDESKSYLHLDIDYKAKPSFLTNILKPKIKTLARDVLLSYKEYIETGAENVPAKKLRKKYKGY